MTSVVVIQWGVVLARNWVENLWFFVILTLSLGGLLCTAWCSEVCSFCFIECLEVIVECFKFPNYRSLIVVHHHWVLLSLNQCRQIRPKVRDPHLILILHRRLILLRHLRHQRMRRKTQQYLVLPLHLHRHRWSHHHRHLRCRTICWLICFISCLVILPSWIKVLLFIIYRYLGSCFPRGNQSHIYLAELVENVLLMEI